MTYDFSSIVSREGINAAAMNNPIKGSTVKEGFTKIPMHVADMNYATVPTIAEEIKKRLENPTFGYFGTADEYYDSIIDWHFSFYSQMYGYKKARFREYQRLLFSVRLY